MKGSGQNFPLLHKHGVAGILCEYFDRIAGLFNDGRANKNHLDRLFAQCARAHVNVARKLAAVAISQHRRVEQSKRILRWAMHFACQQNRSGARTEKGAALGGKALQGVEEAFLFHHLQVSGALATRKNYAAETGQILGRPHERVLRAETIKHLGMSFIVALYGENADFCAVFHSEPPLNTQSSRPAASLLGRGDPQFLISREAYQPRVCSRSFSSS